MVIALPSQKVRMILCTYMYSANISLISTTAALAFGLIGSILFIIIQIILLVDLAHRLAEFL